MEIERKYLLDCVPFDLSPYTKSYLAQSYISTDPAIRLRKSVSTEKTEYVLTVKGVGLLVRDEFELTLSQEQYEKLMLKTETVPIVKTRYRIPLDDSLVAELDIYHEFFEGLITVEVEFSSQAQADEFSPPPWFGRDVTFDSAYKNSALAKKA